MIPEVLSFLSKSSRPALTALAVGAVVAYFIPDAALEAVGFNPTVTKFGAIGIQLAAAAALIWPFAERKWLEARTRREADAANQNMRNTCLALSDEAKFVFAYFVHSAGDYIFLPMGGESVLALEGAGLLKRLETQAEVAKLYAPDGTKRWIQRDFAWAISNLDLDSDRRVKFEKFEGGCEKRFYGRV